MTRLLEGKHIVVYGAGGGVGRGVARTFAREGATVFLASDRAGSITGTIVNLTCGLVAP